MSETIICNNNKKVDIHHILYHIILLFEFW